MSAADHACCASQAEAITQLIRDNARLLDALEQCMRERDEARNSITHCIAVANGAS